MSSSASSVLKPIVFGFGNPLLDIQFNTDSEFLKKYKLEHGGFTFQGLAQENIYEDMGSRPEAGYIAGGSTLNSMRVCQALSKRHTVFYTGCVGKDEYAKKLIDLCNAEGLITNFATSDTNATGVCGVAIVNKERSLCTRIGAASDLKVEDLKKQWSFVETANVCYSAGFLLSVCVEGMRLIGDYCSRMNKIYATNLAATFFVETFKDEMMSVMPYVDLLFGNESEFSSFAKVHGWGENLSLEEIGRRIVDLPKANSSRSRVVIITQGCEETVVASRWNCNGLIKITKFPIVPLRREEIVDTNAAGDGFVGGFLYGLTKAVQLENSLNHDAPLNFDIDLCIHFAHVAARHIVQREGCSFDFTTEEIEVPNPNFQRLQN